MISNKLRVLRSCNYTRVGLDISNEQYNKAPNGTVVDRLTTITHLIHQFGTLLTSSQRIINNEHGALNEKILNQQHQIVNNKTYLKKDKSGNKLTAIERIAATRGSQTSTTCFVRVLAPAYPVPSHPHM